MKKEILLLLMVSTCACTTRPEVPDNSPLKFRLETVASGIKAPVGMAHAEDASGRLFIIEQAGIIRILKDGQMLEKPFLDISSRLVSLGAAYTERGLLGIAFHPDYSSNGRFFLYYSAPSGTGADHKTILAEYRVSSDPDIADIQERIILEIEQPQSNHNGGQLLFAKDGYLYLGTGDGGGGGDPFGKKGNAQNTANLLGKILRINIDSGDPYDIPADNPFAGREGRDEIWAYGLRNPWRFSVDPATGRMFCGDVGQNKFEEINIIEGGNNYGWRFMEGFEIFDKDAEFDKDELTMPIDAYGRDKGISVIGGYVYRGKKFPALTGLYIFGDWNGKMYYLTEGSGKWERFPVRFEEGELSGEMINSFGEDEEGEIYVLAQRKIGPQSETGKIYRLTLAD